MTFNELLASDVTNVFLNRNEFGEVLGIVYTTVAGVAKTIYPVLEPIEFLDDRSYADGRQIVKSYIAFVDADVTLGIASPARGDYMTVGGIAFKVDKNKGNDKGMHELVIVRNDVIENSPSDFRIPSRN